MPQIFQVLRCYKCSIFQVHQTNKSNKWECKVCGEKQSVKRFYGLGTAKECRFHVQKLNAIRGEQDRTTNNTEQDNVSSNKREVIVTQPEKDDNPIQDSKWLCYIEEAGTIEKDTDTNISPGGAEVVLELPKKRRKLNTNNRKTNPILLTVDHEKIHDNNTVTLNSPVMPNAIINLANTESKTPKPSSHFEAYHPDETFNKINTSEKFVPPLIDKNSKWAQFTDLPDLTDEEGSFPPFENKDGPSMDVKMGRPDLPDQSSSLPPLLSKDGLCAEIKMERPFSWCDDEPDIDSILSF